MTEIGVCPSICTIRFPHFQLNGDEPYQQEGDRSQQVQMDEGQALGEELTGLNEVVRVFEEEGKRE